MNVAQIQMCSQLILSDFKMLKIADLNLISQMAIRGEFGQFYEAVSIPKVLEWFKDYFEQRCEIGMHISQQANKTGEGEMKAKDVVSALVEIGIIDQSLIDSIGKNTKEKEEEFRRVNAEYHRNKISPNE